MVMAGELIAAFTVMFIATGLVMLSAWVADLLDQRRRRRQRKEEEW